MSRVSIGIIAERIVIAIGDGADTVFEELTEREALKLAGSLATAIHQVGRCESVAPCWRDFIDRILD